MGRKSLAQPLGMLLRYAWNCDPELHHVQAVIPVPLYPKNERARGFNQAELLASRLAKEIGRPLLPLLIRTRKTPSQTDLSRSERRENVRSAFAIQPLTPPQKQILRGRPFLLVDDVCTTASTLAECARVLRQVGAGPVKALVLARDL